MNKNLFSGIQPSGIITIGNFIGVLSKWINYQYDYNCYFCINDLHSITNKNILFSNKEYKKKIIFDTLSLIISSGINPNISNIFLQSKILEHTYLFWILLSNIKLNKIIKNININDRKNIKNIEIGKLSYSILMTSDILLYQIDTVFVGYDQIKNIELCKYIINIFNKRFDNLFKEPNFIINKNIIKSLNNPNKKMSKSDINSNSYISLLDNYDLIKKKIKLSITDSDVESKIIYNENDKKGISNLIKIMSEINNISINKIEKSMINKNYNFFKNLLSKNIYYKIEEIQYNYNIIRKNENYLKYIIEKSTNKIRKIAEKSINEIKNKIGIYE
ncbi:tryptophan--tRNA ligase [Candidatus Nardonella dryophthoridicola]|uniref:Tryptophan--tRNA ligase n=1 Tax=endosymbiont of Rhynchophorus ferrugineus TaxID=1972133 RepID=A0A2Z5T3Q7_9GAMM|nr:tryptophan--tRNA ligase [Candidatus Nardonella dryophthoridicola]BBA85030.1 tryptophan--tRNA ligase [endosymbiont of Rhynchophorus ferrugineus]